MANCVAERSLLAIQDGFRQIVATKCMAEQVFPFAIDVSLDLRIQRHHIADKVQIAKRYARLQRVHADAAICTQHIVHVQLADAFLRFPLKCLGVWRKVRVLIAEQLIGDLARE